MISILLASYNGERFIKEQIESLLGQTNQEFRLFICDDKSSDNTFEIISSYAVKYPDKIFIKQNSKNTGGAKYNFINMMIEYKDDHVMLCDQDDIWLPDKIETTLKKIYEMEAVYGKSTPLLVHSDLTVVDEELRVISDSFMKTIMADYSKTSLNSLITQNTLTGCTAMYNRALAELITAKPEYMIMHDWWLMLTAAAFGQIGTVNEPVILYRQHGNNEVGAKKVNTLSHMIQKIVYHREMSDAIKQTYAQADSFLKAFGAKLTESQRELLENYAALSEQPRLKRLITMFRYKTFKHGFLRKALQIIITLTARHDKNGG